MALTSSIDVRRAVPPAPASLARLIAGASTVTQARPPAIAIACGLPPTLIVDTPRRAAGSIRVTVPSPLSATQTEPAPNVTPVGDSPTGIVAVTDLVSGSIRMTVLSPVSATQTAPSPTAMPLGPWPTESAVTRPVESTRVTLSASLSVSQTPSAPTASPAGPAFGSTWPTTRTGPGVQASQLARIRRDPERLAARRERRRASRHDVADGCGSRDRVERRVNAVDGGRRRAGARCSDPHLALRRRDPGRRVGEGKGPKGPKRSRVDARDRLIVEIRDPQRAGSISHGARASADGDLCDDAIRTRVDRGDRVRCGSKRRG